MAELPPDIDLVESPVRIIKASRVLQEKAGSGEIDPLLVERAELYLQDNREDFVPLALDLMHRLAQTLETLRGKKKRSHSDLAKLQQDVMQIKANGKMFRYAIASEMADPVLDLLERIRVVDDDVLDLVQAHLAGLNLVIARQIRNASDINGRQLLTEIESACERYFKKNRA